MRIGIASIWHESNTFLKKPTTLEDFRHDLLLTGPEIRNKFAGAHHEIGGFFAGLNAAGFEAVPLLAARALPSGTIAQDAWQALFEMLFAELERAGPLAGLLVAPHGAAVGEGEPDLDGAWLAQLRAAVGPELPIIGTLDPHANLSRRMVDSTTALCAYRTNPHLDQRETGLRAAALLIRTLRGEVRPVQAAAFPPLAINIERQFTAESPCADLLALADSQLARPGLLANSVLLGFPYADVPEMGSALLAVADADSATAQRAANELAAHLWENREAFTGRMLEIEDALTLARNAESPVCLLDMGDNVGGGAPGDGTWLLHALHAANLGPAFVCLCDSAAGQAARELGVGGRGTLEVGGRSAAEQGPPFCGEFTVLGLYGGRFSEQQVRHGGITEFDQGPTTVVRTPGGIVVMLTSRPMPPFSLAQLTSCGIEPGAFRVLVAKGVHAPVAAYREVCRTFLRVNTPGLTTADLSQLEYRHRRRPVFPWETAEFGEG